MELRERRAVLESQPNPDPRLDYVSMLSGDIRSELYSAPLNVQLSYVPDRVILKSDAWWSYLRAVSELSWTSVEELGVTLLADLNDELVARWIEVSIAGHDNDNRHGVVLSERQPDWDNPALLSRLLPLPVA